MPDLRDRFKGVLSAIITPFNKAGEVDTAVLRELVRWELEVGVHGFFTCGSTGEGPLMSVEERKRVSEAVVEEAGGKATVIVHVGASNTAAAQELARHAEDIGAAAVSSIPPIYYPHSAKAIAEYYRSLAEATSLPLMVYNIPARTGIPLQGELLEEVLKIPTVKAVKNTEHNLFTFHLLTKRGLIVINGYDEVFLAGLVMGATGMIGTTVNLIPQVYLEVYDAFLKGDLERARKAQRHASDLVEAFMQYDSFLGATKVALEMMGFPVGQPRRPLRPLPREEWPRLRAELERLGVLPAR
jgi:N-acetylneuraminate lyase